jgi:hypothetical protein
LEKIAYFAEITSFSESEKFSFVFEMDVDFEIENEKDATANAADWNDGLTRVDLDKFKG